MLGRHHDRVGAHRLAVLISERDLAFGVRAKLRHPAGVPRLGHLMQDAVGVINRRRHQGLGLAAGIAEHDALVAGALFLLLLGIGIDAHGDVGRLLVHVEFELGVLPVKALLLVADLAHGAARGVLDQSRCHGFRSAHLSGHDDAVGRHQCFDSHPRMRIGGHVEIYHGIGDAVAHLVGVTFRYRLAAEEIVSTVRHVTLYEFDGGGRDRCPAPA